MPACTCDSCSRFEQASGFPRLLSVRTIRRHLQKQKAAANLPSLDIDNPLSHSIHVSSPSLSIVNSPIVNSPSIVNSPILARDQIEPLSELRLERELEYVEGLEGRSRGRPRTSIEWANQPLGSLLLDMRDKFPNMTERVMDSQFALHNANKSLWVNVDTSKRFETLTLAPATAGPEAR